MKTSKPLIIVSIILLGIAGYATFRLTTPINKSGLGTDIPNGYDQVDDIRGVVGASLAQGDAQTLGKYLADEVSMDLVDEGDIYFKEDAVELLSKFFVNYPPSQYNEKHRGSSGSGEEQYLVGELITAKGTFRSYLLTKNAKIIELKISEE